MITLFAYKSTIDGVCEWYHKEDKVYRPRLSGGWGDKKVTAIWRNRSTVVWYRQQAGEQGSIVCLSAYNLSIAGLGNLMQQLAQLYLLHNFFHSSIHVSTLPLSSGWLAGGCC